MFTKYGKINNEIVAVDEKGVFHQLDNTNNVDVNRSLELENLLEVLELKKINLDFKLENLEKDFKNYKTPKRELVKFLSSMNIFLLIFAILALVVRGAFTMGSGMFLLGYEVVMLTATFTINSMAREEYSDTRKELIKEYDNTCKLEEETHKELDNIKISSNVVKTVKVKNVDEHIRQLNKYKNTYINDDDYQKRKRLTKI